jgi:hypothetical protein
MSRYLSKYCVTESYLHVANKTSVEKLIDFIPSISVADPDLYDFEPPGSGSVSRDMDPDPLAEVRIRILLS